jgi:hypothetical protein
MPSAANCRNPKGPTRFGPSRFCMRAIAFRSQTVVMPKHRPNTARIAPRLMTNADSGRIDSGIGAVNPCSKLTNNWSSDAAIR